MSTTYHEVLPATLSSPHAAITWSPSEGGPGLGQVRIDQKRASVLYVVQELPTDWREGRAFAFHKPAGEEGTDAENATYEVFVANPQDHLCDCKGHQRHGHCKHVAAVMALLSNGWV